MTRQGEWKKKYQNVSVPAVIKRAIDAYAEHEGLKQYRALEILLKDNPVLKPFIKEEESHAIA